MGCCYGFLIVKKSQNSYAEGSQFYINGDWMLMDKTRIQRHRKLKVNCIHERHLPVNAAVSWPVVPSATIVCPWKMIVFSSFFKTGMALISCRSKLACDCESIIIWIMFSGRPFFISVLRNQDKKANLTIKFSWFLIIWWKNFFVRHYYFFLKFSKIW